MIKNLAVCYGLLAMLPGAFAESKIWNTNSIHWQEVNADGTKYAVLEGKRTQPGTFSYAFFMPDGVWYPAHCHSADARVTVASGTLLLGDGPVLNKANARVIRSGGFFLVPKESAHWEGARGDTLIIGVASGPWVTTMLPVPKRQ